MTDNTQPAATPAQPTFWQKAGKWVVTICGLIVAGIGLLRLMEQFSLPSCTSDRAKTTIQDIFKSKDVPLTSVSDMKTVSDTRSEKTCTAHVESKDETAEIDYKISWEGWTAQVLIASVHDEKRK